MSGFRDSLKGQYYGELSSGLTLVVRGSGWAEVEGEELDQWGWGICSEEGEEERGVVWRNS